MTDEQLEILANELKKINYYQDLRLQRYDKVADKLNATTSEPNPEPRRNVPAQFTWDTFLVLLSGAEVWGLYAQGNFSQDLRRALENNSVVERTQLWKALKTVLPPATVTKIETEFGKTIQDPNWSSTVTKPSIATSLGLPRVRPADIQRVEQGV